MKVSFTSKGDFGIITRILNRAANKNPSSILRSIASEGTQRLASGTHRDTGETASGWTETITTSRNVSEIVWTNRAHPHTGVSIAKMIELGHGTGTGGYVAPRPYIRQSMKPVWDSIDNKVVKEMMN